MSHTATWDESQPAGNVTAAASLDTIIQNMKRDERERLLLEHNWNGSAPPGTTYDGVHKEGSARLLLGLLSSRPSNRGGGAVDGAGGNEEGRIFVASDGAYVNPLQVSDGTNWQRLFGLKVAASATRNTTGSSTAGSYPAFNGGTAQNYLQASFDFTGRSGNSTVFILAYMHMELVDLFNARLCRDSNANTESPFISPPIGGPTVHYPAFFISLNTAMSAGAHILDMQFSSFGGSTVKATFGAIYVFDLGVT